MWCGSFNTWMDVETLALGLVRAWREYRRLRVRIVGGKCANYNDRSFDQFLELVRKEGATQMIEVFDWQPLGVLQNLYAECNVGLSIDRPTYEALLGSRTRFIHFLLAGKPVISTAITELADELAAAEALLPFRAGDPDDLARVVLEAAQSRTDLAERGEALRKFVFERFNGRVVGAPLMEWLSAPTWAPDKTGHGHTLDAANPLTTYWSQVLAQAP
jgi:glycosyltransferase involved in cell wall biosynthesis